MSRYVPSRSKPTLHLNNRLGLDSCLFMQSSCARGDTNRFLTQTLFFLSFMQNLVSSQQNRNAEQYKQLLPIAQQEEIKPVCIRCLARNQVAWQAHQYQPTCNQANLLQSCLRKYTIPYDIHPCSSMPDYSGMCIYMRSTGSYRMEIDPRSLDKTKEGGFLLITAISCWHRL